MAAALIAGAFGAAGTAQAASQQDDFTQGTPSGTEVVAGGVQLASAFTTTFAGSALPADWETTNWDAAGSVVPGNGLTLNQARAKHAASTDAGSSLQFRATFGNQSAQHVGFGVNYIDGPWAVFSTSATNNKVFARINTGSTPDDTAPQVEVGNTGTAHDFRIDWTENHEFVFYVDGVEKARHVGADRPALRTLASDYGEPGSVLKIDSMTLRNASSPTSGTYTSKVFDAGSAAVTGINFSGTSASGITYETSTSSDNVNWTQFSPGAIQPARYFKYRATFNAANPGVSPRLTNAVVDFAIANPTTGGTTNTPPPSGDTKKPRLGMPRDADVNRRGKVKILLTCPDDELFCRAALVFKSGRKTIASKSGKIAGGDSRYITLKLSTAAKKQLAKARKLKVAATLTVIDAAGNKRTSSKKIWLYPM